MSGALERPESLNALTVQPVLRNNISRSESIYPPVEGNNEEGVLDAKPVLVAMTSFVQRS
jgi:hypothetical protein